MFAPEGYLPFSSLWPQVVDEGSTVAIDRFYALVQNDPYLALYRSPFDFLEQAFFRMFRDAARICSPSGQLLNFDIAQLREGEFYFTAEHQMSREEEGGDSDETQLPYDFIQAQWLDLIFYSEGHLGEFGDIESELLLSPYRGHLLIPLYYQRAGYTLSGTGFDLWGEQMRNPIQAKLELSAYRSVRELIRPFEGWAICVAEKNVPQNLKVALVTEINEAMPPKDFGKAAHERVCEHVRQAYPNGKGDATWAEVEKKVGFSRRHIVRAFEASESDW